jgi:hypothetical protein
MGSSVSKKLGVPLAGKLDGNNGNPYDRFSDVEESGAVKIETSITTSKRPMWKHTLVIFIAFLVFVTATGISCALEDSCKTGGPPTMSHMLNTTKTSLYLMTAINSLIGVHLTEVYSIGQLVIERAPILGVIQWIVAGLLYISIFVNLAFNKWYIMTVSAVLILLWMCFVTEALRRFYIRGRSRLWKLTVFLVIIYAISATIYIVFSAVPQLDFPHKDIGVLAAEILVIIASAGFAFILIPHTRWVIIETIVKK